MTQPTIIPINYIERKPNSEKYRIVGKGVTVEFLSTLIDHPDWTMESICENYNLTPAEVHAAWAFYYDHQAEIDARVQIEPKPLTEAEKKHQAEFKARYRAKTGQSYPANEIKS